MSLPADDAAAQAERLLQPGAPWPPSFSPGPPAWHELLALAWALKDQCYAAWAREPARAARAAEVLQALAQHVQHVQDVADGAERSTVRALADWTAGISAVTRGEMAPAVQRFDAAAAGLRAAGRADEAAQTQVPKIMALTMLGRHDAALQCADAAQAELLALGNVAAAARVSLNVGGICAHRDAYADAARHYREAAVLFARLVDHPHSVLADIGLVHALRGLGDFEEAGRIQARARMRAGNQGLQQALAQLDESQALLDLTLGRYRSALAGLEAARRRYAALDLPHSLAIAEKQLADAYLELRLLPEAWTLFDAAVARFRALQLPDEQAGALAQRGRAEALLADPAADASFAAAAALFEEQGNAVGQASVLLARSELALLSHDAAAALVGAARAGRAFADAGQADGRARAEVIRAQALLQTGAAAPALALFDAVLAQAQALQQLQVQLRCLGGRGLALVALGRREEAAQAFERAIERFEDQRRALPGDEIRSAFLGDHLRPYQECLRLALDEPGPRHGTRVLEQLERFRARALDDRLAGDDASASEDTGADAGNGASGDADTQALRERLNWLYHRFHRGADGAGAAADEAPALREEMLRSERELLERARRQRLAAPLRQASIVGGFDAAALQSALHDGDALVEYGVLDDELFACVVTPAGIALQRHLAPWSQTLEAVRAARFQLEALRDGSAHLQRHMATLQARAQVRLQTLHERLIAPLLPLLEGVQRLIVVPHAQLGAVPFAALGAASDPAALGAASDASALGAASDASALGAASGSIAMGIADEFPPLGTTLQLAVAPSARAALRGLQRAPLPARRVLALGESSRLPHAAQEAQQVVRLFAAQAAAGQPGEAFVGTQATVQALRVHGREADVLHLACHAQFRSDNPRFSALHLHDGALTVELAEALDLRPCTVVLSACETALAESGSGDEMVGLVRAFLVAGAARVVASLWPVDDAVTAGFMAAFYGALVHGSPPARALQAAQQATRALHPHPCFWGAFTLYGGW